LRYWEEYSKTVGGVATTPPSFSPALGGSVRQELGSVRQTHRRTTQIRTKQEKGQQQSGSSINMKSENETKDVVDSSLISKIVKEYKAITGQEDLTPRLLRQRLSKLNNLELTEEYIDEKMLLLKQSLEKTKNPAGFFITAIIEDWKPVLDIDDTTKKTELVEPACPDCSMPISMCSCNEIQESPLTKELRSEAKKTVIALKLEEQKNSNIFMYLKAEEGTNGELHLYPVDDFFKAKIIASNELIDRVMQQMGKTYKLFI
jgi:hypothetical protein